MANTERIIAAPAAKVWATLEDGWGYAAWVVGTIKVRRIDGRWPHAGSVLHHAVGSWPFALQDRTEVAACEVEEHLRLRAHAWPFGAALVDLRLRQLHDGTLVQMFEKPMKGPGAWFDNPLVEKVGRRRLDESLDRLARIVEGRAQVS